MTAEREPVDDAGGVERASRILIVDDTPANLSLVVDTLHGAGLRPFVATSGALALQRLAQTAPDLILLDMRMPGLDGFATLERLRADVAGRQIPVIFMTAVDDPEQKVAGFAAGAVDYVTKPCHPAELLARIRTHLRLRALQRQLENELAWRAATERALRESLEQAVAVATREGAIQFRSQRAGLLLQRYFPGADADVLPAALRDVVQGLGGVTVVANNEHGQLEARVIPDPTSDDLVLLRLEEKRPAGTYAPLSQLGLSEREAEVLFWMSEGKSNPEIGIIVGAATATVKKHAENIYAKLGVEGRAAAMLRALEILRGR